MAEPLLKFYDENPDFVAPKSRRNEVISFVKGGMHDCRSAAPASNGASMCRATKITSCMCGSTR